MELFRLFGSVMVDDKDAIEALKRTDKKAGDSKKSLDKIVETGAKVGAAIVAGTTLAIAGLVALANNTAGVADKWDKLSLRTGIAVENLQRWGYAASQSGADISVLETGIKKMSDQMILANEGNAAAQDSFSALGISMQQLATMTPEQTFEAVMAGLAGMEEGASRNSIGNDLLGKSFVELKPLIAGGKDEMLALKDRADELGLVMSGDAVKAGVVYGDTMDDVKASLGATKDKLVGELMPSLTKMLEWILAKMPKIQEVAKGVFDKIGDAVKWVIDNSNWLIPILAGVAGGFAALVIISTITKLMTAFKAITTAVSVAQGILNAVMAANPVGLIVIGIAALIAIGVLLWKNWDTIKAAAQSLWEKITGVFSKVKDAITKPFETAISVVKGIIDKIKGFFNFQWEFPKIKLPHFNISGSMNPLKWIDQGLPKISVKWYAKGGIFDKPTLFNTPYGLKGVGEAGPEVVAPLGDLKKMLNLDDKAETVYNIYLNNMPADDTDKRKLAQYIEEERRRGLRARGAMA